MHRPLRGDDGGGKTHTLTALYHLAKAGAEASGFPGATLPVVLFPEDSAAVQDSPRLALIVLDPETILRRQIVEFVSRGEFGLASGAKDDGAYGRLWPALATAGRRCVDPQRHRSAHGSAGRDSIRPRRAIPGTHELRPPSPAVRFRVAVGSC